MANTNYAENWYYLAFSYFGKIGPGGMKKIEKAFGNPKNAFNLSPSELIKAGIPQKIADDFFSWRKTFSFDLAAHQLIRESIKFITWHEPNYPFLLQEISSPPYILYYKGNIESVPNKKRLAVVGSRKSSP